MPTRVAYFSMEIMLETDIPSYAGGLGVLAGDILRSCADMSVRAIGVSLVYSGSTFNQIVEPDGSQIFVPIDWQRLDQLTKLPHRTTITLAGTEVTISCWRYDFVGLDGFVVPVILLDTNLPENLDWVQNLTRNLYAGNPETRLCQEALLGIGGIKMLEKLEITDISTYHMNEGHCSFVPLGLIHEKKYTPDQVKACCVFTTHTPVPEGHDHFEYPLAQKYLEAYLPENITDFATASDLSMTHLGLSLSHTHMAVSKKHQEVCESMFPDSQFTHITNGIHHRNWTWHAMQNLYDAHIPGWLANPSQLSHAAEIPDMQLQAAHKESKSKLIKYVNTHLTRQAEFNRLPPPDPNDLFDIKTLTIALGRRPVPYKRPLLLYQDLQRLKNIGTGVIQIVQCGKSHPDDPISQSFVKELVAIARDLKGKIRVTYLENYAPKIARVVVAGCDIWLNTPRRPLEASGTSGMKAAINGALNWSVADGWWLEAIDLNPNAGFSIGPTDLTDNPTSDDTQDAESIYSTLESSIIPLYYQHQDQWLKKMKSAISVSAHFTSHRVVADHLRIAWK